MDHAINSLNTFFEIELDHLYDEWKTGEYKKLSDCPSYGHASAYRQAINVLKKFYYRGNYDQTPLKGILEGHVWVARNEHINWKISK